MESYLLPADELALIRAKKRKLSDRERQLRDGFLTGRLNPVGLDASVEVKVTRQRLLRKEMLPPEIRNNPQFWDTREVTSVVLRKVGARGALPTPQQAADPRGEWSGSRT
ncbi:hypothetical protein [Pseudooctadecabacter jejudonensis]|uniref:Uncharacterized protein n=1 Tax=Pseudooctadecabacter jejudonensis TaxID=1391910 RepID=A0A1Y5S9J0_9RHOB|nr:hypothetical protein [Pseudooctadecabacter jejudonensis]SLN35570.1 hypothetical protein PSJ8397_01793 [Pseudooctadecabacter jejudonensis]